MFRTGRHKFRPQFSLPISNRPLIVGGIAMLFAGCLLSGCSKQEQIRRYTAPKQPKPAMPTMPAMPMATGSPASAAKVSYVAPQGWTELAAGGMRKAAFEVSEGDNKGEITIISLPGAAGGLLENVNRWRGQVNLPPTDIDTLTAESVKMPIGGIEGQYVELVGPESAEKPETILGAIVTRADNVWFIKLRAPSSLAAREKPAFEEFLKSITFSSSDGA